MADLEPKNMPEIDLFSSSLFKVALKWSYSYLNENILPMKR